MPWCPVRSVEAQEPAVLLVERGEALDWRLRAGGGLALDRRDLGGGVRVLLARPLLGLRPSSTTSPATSIIMSTMGPIIRGDILTAQVMPHASWEPIVSRTDVLLRNCD